MLTATCKTKAALVLALVPLLGLSGPPVWAQDGDAVVIVNGQPISKQRMVGILMDAHGLEVMQQLIVLELAREETRRLKIRVTDNDVDLEFDRALGRIAPEVDAGGQKLSDAEKQQALELLLQRKGITLAEFKLGMQRNAHLRKVVEHNFRVDEDTLREEFARLYGERVEVRHIQVGDVSGLHEALNQLQQQIEFADVARRVSQNAETAPNGGLLPPFAFNDEELSPLLREAAFSLKVGEVSKPIKVGRWFHILKLQRRIPPSGVSFAEMRDEVQTRLRDRVIAREMNELITRLFERANIRVLDNDLKRKFEKLLRESAIAEPAAAP